MSLKYEIIDGKIVDSSGNEIKENVSVNDLYYNSNQIKEIYFNGNKCNFVGLDKDKNFYLVLGEIKHKGIGYSKYTMSKLYPDTYRTMAEIPGELLNDDGSIDLITDSLANSFSSCYAITKIPKIINTNKSTNNDSMFYRCHSLLSIPKLDTGNVTNMRCMFYKCGSITSLDLSNWDTSKVTDMSYMFYICYNLTTIIGVIDMKSCTDYQYMFKGSTKLTGVKLKNVPSHFDASEAGLSEGQYTIVS